GIYQSHRGPERWNQCRRGTAALDHHHRVGIGELQIRGVELRAAGGIRPVHRFIPDVPDNPDDLDGLRSPGERPRGAAEPDALAQRTFAGPEAPRRTLTDHDDSRTVRTIARSQPTTGAQRDPQGLEIVR